jgi:4-amino-4-deoxy-L-arabinose transferase-like glycosyltransferase
MLRDSNGLDGSLAPGTVGARPAPVRGPAVVELATTRAVAHPLGWIVGAFLVAQAGILWLAPNGPFVDEGLYATAGLRVLEGKAVSDGYAAWFNGSPFVWPVIAAAGHRVAGLAGARFMAVVLSTLTLVALAMAARHLVGPRASTWCALGFALNGLFSALAHFAVYDVAALTCLATSIWCVSRSSDSHAMKWIVGAAAAFALGVIAKYGYLAMAVPLVGLLVSVRGVRTSVREVALLVAVVSGIVGAYFLIWFGTIIPPSSDAYLGQIFGRTRGHIAALHVVFGLVPFGLAVAGAIVAWRRLPARGLAATCVLAPLVFPAFHLWTANFVSGQKHVVAGFLFAYLLAGIALEKLWDSRSRVAAVLVLAFLTLWGGLQCYVQDRSWPDIRPLADYLVRNLRSGDRVVAESSWSYTLYLYPSGLIASPSAVIDANHSPERGRLDVCRIPWVVGNPDSAPLVRYAVERCGHELVLSTRSPQYYVDTGRLRLTVSSGVVGLYRLPRP